MMTHGNIVATTAAVMTVIPRLGSSDVYLAYLPLAHVFELAAESIMLTAGAAIGYGSALTLTDGSNKIKKGTMGDASELKPSLMAAVPAILDRVRDGVVKKVEEKGGIAKKLFHIAYKRRLAAVEGSWFGAWGVEKQFWDAIVFKKIRTILGGEIRFVLCGGAPLSADTQRFINVCMGAPIGQGYGLTETCVGASFSEWDDPSVGRVGPPLPCAYIKVGDDGSQRRQHKNGGKSDSQKKEIAHEVQGSKPRLAACDTQPAALESIPVNIFKVPTSGECYDGPSPSTVKLDHQGDERHSSAVSSAVDAIRESRLGSASMPTELVPPRSSISNRISKEFKLNPGAKIFSPSLPQQRTATPPAAPTVASLSYSPNNYPIVPLPTSQPEVEINHFPPRSSLPVKFVPYGNMIAGNGGNDVHYSPPIVGHVANRAQPIRYGAQYHSVQAGPTYVHPSSQNVMVGRLGQLVYVHPVSQDMVQGSTGFSQVSTCSLLTPHQIHLPKHQGTGAAQALQMCVTPPFIAAAGQPQFTMPSHIPISQPHFPMIRPISVPGSNGFLGSKYS